MTESILAPEIADLGPSPPEVAVVGGIHGDEPSGVRAVRRLRDAALEFDRGVRFVIANPPAVEANVRYLDADLNRSFPGDPAGNREERLAARLCEAVDGLTTLSLHSTHSHPEPFALVDRTQPAAFEVAADLPVPYVVDHHETTDGTFTACNTVVTVEAGCQHSDEAAEAAHSMARAFLQRTGALPGDPPSADPAFFAMGEAVEKPADAADGLACSDLYDLHATNFERVDAGEPWASIEGDPLVAAEPFYPILMSECGYENVFGYRGRRLGDSPAAALKTLQAAD